MKTAAAALPTVFHLQPWHDPIVHPTGHDVRSRYVETFWLPILGPTSICLLLRVATMTDELDDPKPWDADPESPGFLVDAANLAVSLGLGTDLGPNGALPRTFERLRRFGVANPGPRQWAVRRRLADVPARLLTRLPEHVQIRHHLTVNPREKVTV